MRTVFLGTSDFAVAVLDRLAESPHRPQLVLTRPDRPRGRGRRPLPPPAAEAARRHGIELAQPESVNAPDALARIESAAPETVLICAYGGLIKEPLLSAHPMLNVHPSLLPRWRGAAPVERAIEAGDRETGVTIMRPTAELDAGPICLQEGETIAPDDDYGALAPRLQRLGAELLIRALDEDPPFREQPEDGATYAPKVEREERRLDPGLPAEELLRRVRALNPHIGTWVELPGGSRLGVRRAAVAESTLPTGDRPPVAGWRSSGDGGAPGELGAIASRLFFATVDGALELLEVQPAGGRTMPAADYLRGHGPPAA